MARVTTRSADGVTTSAIAGTGYERRAEGLPRRTHAAPTVTTANAVSQVRMRASDEGCRWSGKAIGRSYATGVRVLLLDGGGKLLSVVGSPSS